MAGFFQNNQVTLFFEEWFLGFPVIKNDFYL